MVERTVITTAEITKIYKSDIPAGVRVDKKALGNEQKEIIKKALKADDVVVTNVQEFVMEKNNSEKISRSEEQEAVMNFAVAVLAGVAECAKQEDAPIYKGDVEDDYYVRLSDVNEVINKHLNVVEE